MNGPSSHSIQALVEQDSEMDITGSNAIWLGAVFIDHLIDALGLHCKNFKFIIIIFSPYNKHLSLIILVGLPVYDDINKSIYIAMLTLAC